MIRFLSRSEVLELHRRLIVTSGGLTDLYPTLIDKAAALGFSLIRNHPFVDGNKRIGHAAMEVMLMLNGYELTASTEAAEATILAVASGALGRQALTDWVRKMIKRSE